MEDFHKACQNDKRNIFRQKYSIKEVEEVNKLPMLISIL